jgi:hypothetical protein
VLRFSEIDDSQKDEWCQATDVVDGRHDQPTQLALFPDDREAPELARETGQSPAVQSFSAQTETMGKLDTCLVFLLLIARYLDKKEMEFLLVTMIA